MTRRSSLDSVRISRAPSDPAARLVIFPPSPSPSPSDGPDRGDVPGWVMLTLMSAVLVAGLLLIAQPALEGLFNDAISRVTGG
ncbi:hypothetical protein [Kocuria palustris]|uniref:hypothetical protein n=1 Tax=Kocuria palustris TaxID=71999 RepID=UPI0011A11F37|nr:hypothetical protein [Kocuria palustris]